MADGQPIAVAFVEVRPDTDDFRANAEQQIREGVGTGPVDVKGQFQLAGLNEARREVGALTSDLRGVSGQQLQFEGLEEAADDSRLLTEGLTDAASVDLTRTLQPAAEAAGLLSERAGAVASAVSGIPVGVGSGLSEGFAEATTDTDALADATSGLGTSLNDAATAASGVVDVANLVARSERQLAAATAQETQQVRVAVAEEERLIRVRGRRATSVGPFRLAGIGVGVGAAVFTATRALGDLAQGLRVTGDEAGTTTGKLRNAGAALLSGDVVGIFKSLTDETRSYNIEQLKLLANTPKTAAALREMGQGANIARSQLAALEGLTQVPQFLQTRIAGAQLGGDTGAELAALEEADRVLVERIKTVRQLGLDQQTLNTALEEVFRQRKTIRDEIERITQEARPDILAPLVDAVSDARLTGDSAKILAALQAEKRELEKVIDAERTNADDRERFKDELAKVNKDIEATQDSIVAEAQRHRAAMIEKQLAPTEEALLDAQIAGSQSGVLAALRERQADVQRILDADELDGKRLTRDERVRLKGELASVNAQIEGELDAITSEQERHADEVARKQQEADQAFVTAMGFGQQKLRNQQLLAQGTAALADDIRVSEALQRLFRESIRRARRTIRDAELRAETIASLTASLIGEQQAERQLRQQQRQAGLDRREESLDLDIQIAQARENIGAELRAHRAKIRFLQERIRHTREGTNQRKRLILELRQEQQAVRDLIEEQKGAADDAKTSFERMAFDFLQQQAGFVSNLASNFVPAGMARPAPRTTTTQPEPEPQRPPLPRREAITSPFERAAAAGAPSQAEAARALREQGGAPASAGQLDELIRLGRDTNLVLRRIAEGVGHPEAKSSRALGRNVNRVGVD
jgi:hypothetical protein